MQALSSSAGLLHISLYFFCPLACVVLLISILRMTNMPQCCRYQCYNHILCYLCYCCVAGTTSICLVCKRSNFANLLVFYIFACHHTVDNTPTHQRTYTFIYGYLCSMRAEYLQNQMYDMCCTVPAA